MKNERCGENTDLIKVKEKERERERVRQKARQTKAIRLYNKAHLAAMSSNRLHLVLPKMNKKTQPIKKFSLHALMHSQRTTIR